MLEAARGGRSGTLLLRGEAGIGKTSLLEYAPARAEDMFVLRATGVEVESGVAFSRCWRSSARCFRSSRSIPERQAGALRSALAMGPAEAGDRFTTGAAMLSLLAEAAEEQPLRAPRRRCPVGRRAVARCDPVRCPPARCRPRRGASMATRTGGGTDRRGPRPTRELYSRASIAMPWSSCSHARRHCPSRTKSSIPSWLRPAAIRWPSWSSPRSLRRATARNVEALEQPLPVADRIEAGLREADVAELGTAMCRAVCSSPRSATVGELDVISAAAGSHVVSTRRARASRGRRAGRPALRPARVHAPAGALRGVPGRRAVQRGVPPMRRLRRSCKRGGVPRRPRGTWVPRPSTPDERGRRGTREAAEAAARDAAGSPSPHAGSSAADSVDARRRPRDARRLLRRR